jgi:transcription elongation GreA/GreB family factor
MTEFRTNKKKIVEALQQKLETDLVLLREAARATYEAATHEESKPENKYDTRGLEASYLAGAQSKRIGEIEELLSICKYTEIKKFIATSPIAITALVEVELGNQKSFVFLLPKGGGVSLVIENQKIQVIAPTSPLGESLIGLNVGDTAIVEMENDTKEYEILAVY